MSVVMTISEDDDDMIQILQEIVDIHTLTLENVVYGLLCEHGLGEPSVPLFSVNFLSIFGFHVSSVPRVAQILLSSPHSDMIRFLSPPRLFHCLLHTIGYDANILIEWLMESDTNFLEYLLKYPMPGVLVVSHFVLPSLARKSFAFL